MADLLDSKWHRVWSKRRIDGHGTDVLSDLIALDGFDCGAGKIAVEDWRTHVRSMARRCRLQAGSTVHEVGCGAGAFLYVLREMGLRVSGLDYAANLIQAARQAMPDSHFDCIPAGEMEAAPRADALLANSVFHYFPDLSYAEHVLDRMLARAQETVAILEVPDAALREESESVRRQSLDPVEYAEKYRGLEHRYYPREWFIRQAESRGLRCEVFDQCVPNYQQNRFRFNCLIRKAQRR